MFFSCIFFHFLMLYYKLKFPFKILDFFKCKINNQCIDRKHVCDGDTDCLDASDEAQVESGGPCNVKCDNKTNFQCDGNRCIPR